MPGAGPFYYLRQLQEIPESELAVVVYTETNDLQDSYSPLPIAKEHCGFIVIPDGISQHTPCWLLHAQTYGLFIDGLQAVVSEVTPLPLCYNPYLQVACNLAIYRATARIEKVARERSGTTLFLTIPWEGVLDRQAATRYSPNISQLRYYGQTSLPMQAEVVDRLQRLASTAYQMNDHHLSALGAAAVADYILHLICQKKEQNGFLRTAGPSLESACRGARSGSTDFERSVRNSEQ
jgi:hypothetical protein